MTHGLRRRRVVNTRAVHQAAALDAILRARGANPVPYPCIEIQAMEDDPALDSALRDLVAGRYDWLALTSANTVIGLERRLSALGLSLGTAPFRTAAIGPATRDAAQQRLGLVASVVPEEYVAESLGESLPVRRGETVLLPESAIARPTLALMLRERGAHVTVVTAYRTRCGRGGADVPGLLARGEIDAITFTSNSTVTNFVQRLVGEGGRIEDARGICAACIGPVTADAARQHGFENVLVPAKYTLTAMVDVMEGLATLGS